MYDIYDFHDTGDKKCYKAISKKDRSMCGWIGKNCVDKDKANIIKVKETWPVKKKKEKGFTLIELLILVSIIGIIASLIFIIKEDNTVNDNTITIEQKIEKRHSNKHYQGDY